MGSTAFSLGTQPLLYPCSVLLTWMKAQWGEVNSSRAKTAEAKVLQGGPKYITAGFVCAQHMVVFWAWC